MMAYTVIPKWFLDDLRTVQAQAPYANLDSYARLDWRACYLWSKHELGVILRRQQAYAVYRIVKSKNKRVALCWARQLGKSVYLGIFALWMSYHNLFACTVERITPVYLVSRDDKVAMELLSKIVGMARRADVFREKAGKTRLLMEKIVLNAHELRWKNGSFIQSLGPTPTVLGKSAGVLIIDEAAKLNIESPLTNDSFFKEYAFPLVDETGGWIILSSTPRGEQGLGHLTTHDLPIWFASFCYGWDHVVRRVAETKGGRLALLHFVLADLPKEGKS